MIKNWFRNKRKETVTFENLTLPALHLRTGGEQFRDNKYFVHSAQKEITRLKTHFGLSGSSVLLDIGCGFGRLAIGFLSIGDPISYLGIDVNNNAITWCDKHISSRNPRFHFIHLNLQNNRYNPKGKSIDLNFKLPLDDKSVDVVYLYSVFSHMLQNDIKHYLRELSRVLVSRGTVFFTAFAEPDVPTETVNPPGYQNIEWKDALHCVRYNHDFLLTLIEESGFTVDEFKYGEETEGQSAFYLSKT
ncbi:MAG: class I SAM-dependent methyltransferase [Anaerolineaceae bacterium]|nr:class I SAM-dependent methyltransferase [Anaerolineaceae bacterium]